MSGAALSWTGADDATILAGLLALHAPARSPLRIVDVTSNDGSMWVGSGYTPWRLDLDVTTGPHVAADCRALPFPDACLDVVVFDPPHIPGAGARHSGTDWVRRYGLGRLPGGKKNGVELLFTPFLREARRVLRGRGIILAKLSDGVYQDRMRFHHAAFIRRADRLIGLTPCSLVVKVRSGPATPQSSALQYHELQAHSYWIVVRKGGCQGPGVRRVKALATLPMFAEDVA